MNGRDDRLHAAGVKVLDPVPDVPLPPGNDPDTVSRWARAVLDSFGLAAWTFALDHATRRLGCCHHMTRKITLSRLMSDDCSSPATTIKSPHLELADDN